MLFRKKALLFGLESAYGVDPTLTGASNSILTRELNINTFQGNKVELDYERPYLANGKSLYTGAYTTLDFKVDLTGSGTAGTVPAFNKLLRACALAELINATAVTGTAQGGAASTITLATGASAVNNTYNSFLVTLTGGTGSGQTRRISGYVGATKVATVNMPWTTPPDATSQYSIDAQVVYAPISTGFESAYAYYYIDGELHKVAGIRGTVSFSMSKQGVPEMQFNLTGLRVPAAASANPTSVYTAFKEPLPVNKANTPTLMLHGYAAATESIKFDLANQVQYRNVIGSEQVVVVDRKPALDITIEKPDTATKNFDAIIAAHTAGEIYVSHGTSAGGIVHLAAPLAQLMDPKFSESDGLVVQGMSGMLLPTAGDDEFFATFK